MRAGLKLQLRRVGLLFALGSLPACLDSMVGYPCAEGYSACGDSCIDLANSLGSCGACGNVCHGICTRGMCSPAPGNGPSGGAGGEARPGTGGTGTGETGTGGTGSDASGSGGAAGDVGANASGGAAGGGGPGGAGGTPTGGAQGNGGAGGSTAGQGGQAGSSTQGGGAPGAGGVDAAGSDDLDRSDGTAADVITPDVPLTLDASATDSLTPAPDAALDLALEAAPPDVVPPLMCAGPLVPCGGICIPVDNDADNCGSCGNRCGSGICTAGVCEAQGAGHLVLIGHDYTVNRAGFNNLVGNAVLLTNASPAAVLVYEGGATAASISGTDQAINQVSAARNRPWTRTAVSSSDLPTRLAAYDTVVIYAQRGSSDAALIQLGQDWSMALTDFLNDGGTVVVLDGVSPSNVGTFQILTSAGLSAITARTAVTGENLSVVSPGDAVAVRVPRTYRAEMTSVSFTTVDGIQIVRAMSGAPVVLHRTF
jgi:hypothetical protein